MDNRRRRNRSVVRYFAMSRRIFVIQSDDNLVEMNEESYDSEDRFQDLLARYPDLLAGDQINPTTPRRWLLVRREASVPSEEGGGGRWAWPLRGPASWHSVLCCHSPLMPLSATSLACLAVSLFLAAARA